VFTHAHVSMITYRLDVYQNSRIPTLPGPEGPAHTGWLGVVMASGDMWPRVALF